MKVCFMSSADNYHTKKWVSWFASRGHDVHILTLADDISDVAEIHYLESGATEFSSDLSKLRYLSQARKARYILDEISPDLISAHYASSYGTLAALACKRPYALSVWGADVYEFPRKSPFHRALVKFSLQKAGMLLSTSQAMADEASKYTNRKFEITPFGVDTELFRPRVGPREHFTITTVKALKPKYGIDVLLRAVATVRAERRDIDLHVRIAGKGAPEYELELKKLSVELGIEHVVEWLGYIPQEEAAKAWAQADIAVVPSTSTSESFGVSAVEAQACGTPVIVSDVPGLLESTLPGESCLVFPRGDVRSLADKIINLHDDSELRATLGMNGRKNALNKYTYENCFSRIERILVEFAHETTMREVGVQ